jgi:hypothetical protein
MEEKSVTWRRRRGEDQTGKDGVMSLGTQSAWCWTSGLQHSDRIHFCSGGPRCVVFTIVASGKSNKGLAHLGHSSLK